MKSGLSVTFPEEPHHAQNPHSHSLCLLPDRQTGPGGIWKTSKPAWALQHCKPLWEVGMIRSWDNLFPQEPAFSGQIRSRELCSQSMHTLTALQGAEGAFSLFIYIYIYVILYICIYMWFCDRYRYRYIWQCFMQGTASSPFCTTLMIWKVEHPCLAMALSHQEAPHQPGTVNISNTCMILYKAFYVYIFYFI